MKKYLKTALAALLIVIMVCSVACGQQKAETPAPATSTQQSTTQQAPAAAEKPAETTTQKTEEKPAEQPQAAAEPEMKQEKRDIYLGVGSLGGAFYPLGQGMATLVNQYSGGLTMTPEVTGGAVDNVRLVGNKEVDIGITAENNAYDGLAGQGSYTEKYELMGIGRLHPSALHIVVLDDSPIQTIEDLRGKKVTLGAAGSGGIPVAQVLLAAYGMTFDDIVANYLPTADGYTQLGDGNIDASIGLFGMPGSACMELASTKKIRFIDIDQDKIDQIVAEYPYYAQVDISADLYGTDKGTSTIGTVNCLIVRPDLEDNVVYWLAKSIYDNLDELHSINETSKTITQESGAKCSVPLHPGAKRYWEEVFGKDYFGN
ncbi:MAG: TAXI family TRAP transporter solute-binding subunit [Butyrivibrio sp.]|nr:TAXI family TRAP transporter solute-binding subunit [Butyrivibrio sp.]